MPPPSILLNNKYQQLANNYLKTAVNIPTRFNEAAFALQSVGVADGTRQGLYYFDFGAPKILYNGSAVSDLSHADQWTAFAGLDAFFKYCLSTL